MSKLRHITHQESCILIKHLTYTFSMEQPDIFVKGIWDVINEHAPDHALGCRVVYTNENCSTLRLMLMGDAMGVELAKEQTICHPRSETVQINIVKKAAKKLGYRLVKDKKRNKNDK